MAPVHIPRDQSSKPLTAKKNCIPQPVGEWLLEVAEISYKEVENLSSRLPVVCMQDAYLSANTQQ